MGGDKTSFCQTSHLVFFTSILISSNSRSFLSSSFGFVETCLGGISVSRSSEFSRCFTLLWFSKVGIDCKQSLSVPQPESVDETQITSSTVASLLARGRSESVDRTIDTRIDSGEVASSISPARSLLRRSIFVSRRLSLRKRTS